MIQWYLQHSLYIPYTQNECRIGGSITPQSLFDRKTASSCPMKGISNHLWASSLIDPVKAVLFLLNRTSFGSQLVQCLPEYCQLFVFRIGNVSASKTVGYSPKRALSYQTISVSYIKIISTSFIEYMIHHKLVGLYCGSAADIVLESPKILIHFSLEEVRFVWIIRMRKDSLDRAHLFYLCVRGGGLLVNCCLHAIQQIESAEQHPIHESSIHL